MKRRPFAAILRRAALFRDEGVEIMITARTVGAYLGASLALVLSSASWAEEKATADVPQQQLQAKVQYCKTCHGPSGQGFQGAIPIPRLAGQQVEYFQNQLNAFSEGARTNKFMFGVAHQLSPAMKTALAKYFSGLNPKPYGNPPKHLAAAGKKIFQEGVPSSNIPPCASCHGDDAKGNGEFPRLAGQYYAYVQHALTTFEKARGQNPAKPDTSAIMQPIAHALTKDQIADVAAYLNGLH
jgi:cytochrome c553